MKREIHKEIDNVQSSWVAKSAQKSKNTKSSLKRELPMFGFVIIICPIYIKI